MSYNVDTKYYHPKQSFASKEFNKTKNTWERVLGEEILSIICDNCTVRLGQHSGLYPGHCPVEGKLKLNKVPKALKKGRTITI